ncbi:MAG: TetR/AcrR family transcriptional regulator [Spirochaetales bacterium]|nr:TetR/AcrR family transcriptional regulator [Spirochaetales bacterium]
MARSKSPSTDKNRQRIINAATRLIMHKGARQTSLSDIAREVGISKGTLYYYYPSKSELIFDITDRHMHQVTQDILSWITNIKEDIPPQKILQIVYSALLKVEKRGVLHLYLIQEAVSFNPSLQERFADIYSEWKKMLEEGLSKILGPNDNIKILAELILASLDGIIIQSTLGFKSLPIKEMTEYLISQSNYQDKKEGEE